TRIKLAPRRPGPLKTPGQRSSPTRCRRPLRARPSLDSRIAAKSKPHLTPANRTATLLARGRELRARLDDDDEVPELRRNATPTITIFLSRYAHETIVKELNRSMKFI